MTNEELQSKTIDFLRFPLIIGVVLIHARITEVIINGFDILQGKSFPIYDTFSYLISDVMAGIAVPLFFFISGFLFFFHSDKFSLSTYGYKLRKRVHSILIPYLFWNLVVVLLFFLAQISMPGLISGANKLIRDYSLTEWLSVFWSDADGYPICIQLWFLRDLMIVMIFSPLIYVIVKYFSWYAIFVLGILWYLGWWFSIAGFSITAIFFFTAGAYFSIHRYNFVVLFKPYLFPSAIIYSLLVFICVCYRREFWISFIYPASILAGIIFAISLSAYFLEQGKWKVNLFLVSGAFFIYAFHGMPLAFIQKYIIKNFLVINDIIRLAIYFLATALVVFVGLGIYCLLNRYFPSFLKIITGGR